MSVRICIVCGERFIGDSPYCSAKCREENLRIKEHAQKILKREPRKKKIKTELAKINQEAREAHMSYGQYVAMCESEKERARRLAKKEVKEDGES